MLQYDIKRCSRENKLSESKKKKKERKKERNKDENSNHSQENQPRKSMNLRLEAQKEK
jgi:hypothetical protein